MGWCVAGRGRGPRGDDEWCLVISSSWEPALMSSATTSALVRQPLTQVLRNITDPGIGGACATACSRFCPWP